LAFFLKISEIFGAHRRQLFISFDEKIGWATFWGILFPNSSSHLVNLPTADSSRTQYAMKAHQQPTFVLQSTISMLLRKALCVGTTY
jgi:hypothetical protein